MHLMILPEISITEGIITGYTGVMTMIWIQLLQEILTVALSG